MTELKAVNGALGAWCQKMDSLKHMLPGLKKNIRKRYK